MIDGFSFYPPCDLRKKLMKRHIVLYKVAVSQPFKRISSFGIRFADFQLSLSCET
jgi:hypothetical protein